MPTITVNRSELYRRLGREYTEKEFDNLCFEFGIELDEVTTEKQLKAKETGAAASKDKVDAAEEIIFRIEIPANRYDLLCTEGLARALNIFLGRQEIPEYRLAEPKSAPGGKFQQLVVKPNTGLIRPFVVAAVLRGVTFTKASYDSFIDLQDKLHQNVCRKRTLVAIGTHDLDTLQGPFTYDAQRPEEIVFIPLKQTRQFNAKELLAFYLGDEHLKAYVPIIQDSPVYPVIRDAKAVVCSLPPVINGEHSKITLDTQNVFIECTAVDLHKAEVVLETLVCLFSEYCSAPFEVEPVEVTQVDGSKTRYPRLQPRTAQVSLDYIKSNIGIDVTLPQVQSLLKRMGLHSTAAPNTASKELLVSIPANRHDILHACDILEDIGIAYGYNNIRLELPQTLTIGGQFPLNKISDELRFEVARCGFTEALTFTLCSRDDISSKMRLPPTNSSSSLQSAVKIANPKTLDFQVARTSLLPGLLRTLASNKKMPMPLKLFEVADVVLLDADKDVGARNERLLSAVFYNNKGSGFETVHGLLDRVMQVTEFPYVSLKESGGSGGKLAKGYSIRAKNDPRFLEGRAAEVLLTPSLKVIGVMGVLHPEVITNFDLSLPASALEMSIERLYY